MEILIPTSVLILAAALSYLTYKSIFGKTKKDKRKEIQIDEPKEKESVDTYLLRQLNSNPDREAVEVIDACAKVLGTIITRFKIPGFCSSLDKNVHHVMGIFVHDLEFTFKYSGSTWVLD